VHGALDKVPGIGEIAIKVGYKDFTVHYDNAKIKPDEMVKKLVASGEKYAKVKS
jgi:copper chaperone CopZ